MSPELCAWLRSPTPEGLSAAGGQRKVNRAPRECLQARSARDGGTIVYRTPSKPACQPPKGPPMYAHGILNVLFEDLFCSETFPTILRVRLYNMMHEIRWLMVFSIQT